MFLPTVRWGGDPPEGWGRGKKPPEMLLSLSPQTPYPSPMLRMGSLPVLGTGRNRAP